MSAQEIDPLLASEVARLKEAELRYHEACTAFSMVIIVQLPLTGTLFANLIAIGGAPLAGPFALVGAILFGGILFAAFFMVKRQIAPAAWAIVFCILCPLTLIGGVVRITANEPIKDSFGISDLVFGILLNILVTIMATGVLLRRPRTLRK